MAAARGAAARRRGVVAARPWLPHVLAPGDREEVGMVGTRDSVWLAPYNAMKRWLSSVAEGLGGEIGEVREGVHAEAAGAAVGAQDFREDVGAPVGGAPAFGDAGAATGPAAEANTVRGRDQTRPSPDAGDAGRQAAAVERALEGAPVVWFDAVELSWADARHATAALVVVPSWCDRAAQLRAIVATPGDHLVVVERSAYDAALAAAAEAARRSLGARVEEVVWFRAACGKGVALVRRA
jgi:hypothetical protein